LFVRLAASWSGGKDCSLACYRAISDGFEISYLLNFISHDGRCMSHGLPSELIAAQSQAIGIPLVQWRTTWESYEREFKAAFRSMKEMGVEGIVFGDIHEIPKHEGWVDRVCGELNLVPIKPLWGHDPRQILSDLMDEGFQATVIMVKADVLGEEWLGRKVNKIFVSDLLKLGKVDPCGELGEYHTYVTDGPLFKRRIKIHEAEKMLKDGYWYLDVTGYEVVIKREAGGKRGKSLTLSKPTTTLI
jgi:diphthine-ammonia ligase